MQKAAVSDATFTQKYCTDHVGFCVPVHKNWYYASFGSVTASLWHVEIGPTVVENVGDGVITIDLVGGAIDSQDGTVTANGDDVIGYRAWTGGRHFVIKGPASLRTAIEYMTKGITTTETGA